MNTGPAVARLAVTASGEYQQPSEHLFSSAGDIAYDKRTKVSNAWFFLKQT